MARTASPVAFLATAALLAFAPHPADAQRPSLAGEKARVADAVKRDLSRLAALQRVHFSRAKSFASDPKDLSFTPNSGAEISIAFASANAWAANASHASLSPVKCFVIISANDAVDAPTSQPFCTDAEPGTAAGRVAAAGNQTDAEPAATKAPAPGAMPTQTKAPVSRPSSTPSNTPANTTPSSAASRRASTPARSNAAANRNGAPSSSTLPTAAAPVAAAATAREQSSAIRMITRDAGEASVADRVESVTPVEFSAILGTMAREAVAMMDAPPPQVVRDPYESTPEFEARRAAALAEYQAREQQWFRSTKRSFVVTLPVRAVRYDADTELLEFNVEALRLPTAREGRSQLTVACFTRPVFWCMPDAGMTYDANDLWKVPRATARQFDVLRSPMTLSARFTVGGRADGDRALAISLVDMELLARGQLVQKWTGR